MFKNDVDERNGYSLLHRGFDLNTVYVCAHLYIHTHFIPFLCMLRFGVYHDTSHAVVTQQYLNMY
jgi:hypothetical protein